MSFKCNFTAIRDFGQIDRKKSIPIVNCTTTSKFSEHIWIIINVLEKWNPINVGQNKNFHVEGIHSDFEGFRILLRGDNIELPMLRVFWGYRIPSFRVSQEERLLKIWHTTDKSLLGNTFYKVRNSTYAKCIKEMEMDFNPESQLTHYAIFTIEDCIEILSESPPKVEWLNGDLAQY